MSNTQESKVQLEYISKCTDLVKEKYDRQPCFFIQNAGCQMNSLQTDTVAGIVKRMGYKEVEKEFNTERLYGFRYLMRTEVFHADRD